LGEIAVVQGRLEEAASLLQEGLTLAHVVGGTRSIAYCLEGVARLNAARENIETAACIWGAAEKLREAGAVPLPPAMQAIFENDVHDLRCRVGNEVWTAAWERGRAMTMEEAVARAAEKERVG
jgi:hypothetical protein